MPRGEGIRTEQIPVPPPPDTTTTSSPPQGSRGGCLRQIVIGLVAAVVLVVLVRACAGGAEDAGTPQAPPAEEPAQGEEAARERPEPAAEPEPEPEPEPEEAPAVPMGTPVTAGDLEWNVTNARYATELASQFGEFGENKTGNFVVVDFLVTNNGNEATTVASQSVALLDGQGRRSETDTDAFEYVDPAKNVFLEQVNPGVTGEGEVIFSVAPDAGEFVLEVGDASFFGGETGRVNLGF